MRSHAGQNRDRLCAIDTLSTWRQGDDCTSTSSKNVCAQNGFVGGRSCPAALHETTGPGMHTHQSLWKERCAALLRQGRLRGISRCAVVHRRLLKHAPSLARLRRADHETRIAGWCQATRHRSTLSIPNATAARACASRCTSTIQGEAARVPDARPVCNRTFPSRPACMAGLDGASQDRAAKPIDEDLYELEPEMKRQVKSTPGSMVESSTPRDRQRVPDTRRRLHTDLIEPGSIQARARGRPGGAPATSLGVLSLPRHLVRLSRTVRAF